MGITLWAISHLQIRGLPCPVNDVLIVDVGGRIAAPDEVGEIWL